MRGYLFSAAPSFSNQEPRVHKLWPEFLTTIQRCMTGEGWGLFKSVSFSPSLPLLPKKTSRLKVFAGRDYGRHSSCSRLLSLYLRWVFPIKSQQTQHYELWHTAFISIDSVVCLAVCRQDTSTLTKGFPCNLERGEEDLGPGRVDSFSIVIESRAFQHCMWHEQRDLTVHPKRDIHGIRKSI